MGIPKGASRPLTRCLIACTLLTALAHAALGREATGIWILPIAMFVIAIAGSIAGRMCMRRGSGARRTPESQSSTASPQHGPIDRQTDRRRRAP